MSEVSAPLGLALGLLLGFVHAFDADHVVAVSTLATRRPGWRTSLGFSLRWGAGHGATLIPLGALAFALGRSLPQAVSRAAEGLVGLTLIGLGLWVLWDLHRRRVHLHFHDHAGLGRHAHWHSHREDSHHGHAHAATLVGALHGAAGTAPVLALVPVSQALSWIGALAYLSSFALGVVAGMMAFGGLLGLGLGRLARALPATLRGIQAGISLGAIVLGAFWLLSV